MVALAQATLADDVITGLRAPIKRLPCRLLYDARGAELFEQITFTEDYYLTRAELALLEARLPDVAARVGANARVIEPGSGAGRKTRLLLSALDQPASYVPIDVAEDQLADTARTLADAYPGLEIQPLLGDYTRPLTLPAPTRAHGKTLAFFPGSTIGNFEPDEARRFLAQLGQLAGPGAMIAIGADGNADRAQLLRAYDDREGVTAAFDLNVLAHVNHNHGADFALDGFIHRAVWNAARSRVEMHLVSRRDQVATVAGEAFRFARGEPIVTEHCYKHAPEALERILASAGWKVVQTFADAEARMRLWLAER